MDKNTYEMYEYLPVAADNAEPIADQFFVVQDDNTFIIKEQMKFVTQVENMKEVDDESTATMYNVTQQQYLLDVNNSNAGTISIPDNFAEGESNLYSNNFLLQTAPSTNTIQIEENCVVDPFIETEEQEPILSNNESKQDSYCAEITLSEEGCTMYEQKGWVLIETDSKVYILDKFGLHDITTNEVLIKQLRAVTANFTQSRSTEIPSTESTIEPPEYVNQNSSNEQDKKELKTEKENHDVASPNEEDISEMYVVAHVNEVENSAIQIVTYKEQNIEEKDIQNGTELSMPDLESQSLMESNTVRIKTNYIFKDVPDKIVLGKTVSGKRLVAKVVKNNKHDSKNNGNQLNKESEKATEKITGSDTQLPDWQFQQMMLNMIHRDAAVECSAAQVTTASDVIQNLMKAATFRVMFPSRNFLITMISKQKDTNSHTETIMPSIITGRVEKIDGEMRFVYMPDLLQKLKTASSQNVNSSSGAHCPKPPEDYSALHMHITETRNADCVENVSIQLKTRRTVLPLLRMTPLSKRAQFYRMHACGSCAKIFPSLDELTEHQENECFESEDKLTIDTDELPKGRQHGDEPYRILVTNNGTQYVCSKCPLKFNKHSNCQRHMKTHSAPETSDIKSKPQGTYKCKMCPSSYFCSSSLSKHIVKAHIKM